MVSVSANPLVLLFLIKISHGLFNLQFPPGFKNTRQLIVSAGYPAQEYDVITNDGYILRVFRIAEAKVSKKRPPILLMHGIATSSDGWVMQGPGKDLVYMLYDAGYDVWMGDARGNTYSRRHLTLSASDPAFWKFSFHEMGTEDLPAFIDFILKLTGHKKLSYLGHSMGTSSFFVLGSEKPEYMSKIRIFIGFTPVARMDVTQFNEDKHIIYTFVKNILNSFKQQSRFEILRRTFYWPYISNLFCAEDSPTQNLCHDLSFFWAGNQTKRMSKKSLPRIMSHIPAGLSVFTPDHFVQNIEQSRFQQMDFGEEENQRRYQSATPPQYDISRVTCPVAVHFSKGDYLVNSSDVRYNLAKLPKVVYAREYEELNHVDFVWGRTAWREIYPDVLEILAEYNTPSS